MKNAPSTKLNEKNESPKTPGGISKSLLIPCRRVGLSRNWKKAGKSPFVSPLSGNSSSTDIKHDKMETRKRKERAGEEETEDSNKCSSKSNIETNEILDSGENKVSSPTTPKKKDIVGTPSRSVAIPRKKKSKTLLSAINKSKESTSNSNCDVSNEAEKSDIKNQNTDEFSTNKYGDSINSDIGKQLQNSKDVKKISIRNKKSVSPIKSNVKTTKTDINLDSNEIENDIKESVDLNTIEGINLDQQNENISTNKSSLNLTKECIVVIQKNILKTDTIESERKADPQEILKANENNSATQILFDSDTDDVPLSHLDKKENDPKSISIDTDEEDFSKTNKTKVTKLEDKNTSIGDLKRKSLAKKKMTINKKCDKIVAKTTIHTVAESSKPASQSSNSFDDDDDFEFDNKKTIIIRKSYDKVSKPSKAKSTGSITQKDIDDLRARIETKKKLLLAKLINKDTEELRDLIKKWQKGCQDALAELMDLMKSKYPDKQNMDYSEILQMLKIPASLVGYDSENDCFVTPDDSNIILSRFNEL